MKCQRCIKGAEATYRVYSDAMEMKVCAACAAEAQRLGLATELLHPGEVTKVSAKSDFSANEGDVCSRHFTGGRGVSSHRE
jgi:citrate lyase beta subunit